VAPVLHLCISFKPYGISRDLFHSLSTRAGEHFLTSYRRLKQGSKDLLLLGRLVRKLNTLRDVALQVLVAGLEKLLLVVVGLADNVNGLLSTVGL
jgi:hypothetical protein